jgi:hypothetical protein
LITPETTPPSIPTNSATSPATGATDTPRPSGSALASAESTLLATAKIPAAIRPLLGAAPCCAGEQGALYLDILNLHIEVWNPVGLREWQALKRIADCDWECIRYGKATTWGFNAVIARSLFRRIIEHACDKELARLAKEQKFPTHADPSVEMQLSQECFIFWRRTALKAVMGDPAAIREVECQLGAGTVVLDVFAAKEFEEHIPSQIKIECLIQAALKTRDDAYDELEALVSARQQRQASLSRLLPGMSLSEYARSKIIPPTAPQDVLTSATNGAPSDSAHGVEKADIERPCVTDVDVEVPQGAPSQQPTSEVCDVDVKVPTDTSTESAPTKAVETDRSGTTSVDGSSDGTSEIVCDDSMVRQ